jgi:hypothetical protein
MTAARRGVAAGARRCVAAAVLAAVTVPAGGQDAPEQPAERALAHAQTIHAKFPLAAWRAADVDRDGEDDLLAIGAGGEVRVWRGDPRTGRLADQPSGVLVLPEPERSVLALADVLRRGGPPQLAVLSRRGLEVYPVGPEGAFVRAPVLVSHATTLAFRVGEPTFSSVLRDVNGDGGPDLLVPRGDACELWLWTAPAAGADGKVAADALPEYRSVGAFRVDVSRQRSTDAEALSDVLESSLRVPALTFEDVNGDGRRDLLVEDGKVRAFHLAREDGTVAAEADVRVDLTKFEDSTPEGEVRLGRTLAGSDDQRFESADLDGDGIPDHVISHRRKVWVFLGTKQGPQFSEPAQILKVADDVSALLVARLDADPRPDLLLLRLQVPTIATILRGLVASWDVDIGAVGYENDGTGCFATKPRWKGELALRLPAILGILRDPDALVRRMEGLASKFQRGFVWGDFDADGREDAAVASGDERRLDVWFGVARAAQDEGAGSEVDLGGVFFGDDTVWDLDRVLGWLGDFADRRFARVTGGRPPSQRIPLLGADEAAYEGVGALRSTAPGRGAAIVVAYTGADGLARFDVWR